MGVRHGPLLHLDGKPQTVDPEGDDGEHYPEDVLSEQLRPVPIESKTLIIDGLMFDGPSLNKAFGPRIAEAKGDTGDDITQKMVSDQLNQFAVKRWFPISFDFEALLLFLRFDFFRQTLGKQIAFG